MHAWTLVWIAIVLEVAGTTCMKLSDGFTRVWPSVLIFVFYAAAFATLTLALKRLDVGLVYAVWAGAGTVLVAIIGVILFREPVTVLRVFSIALIVAGVVGLSVGGEHP